MTNRMANYLDVDPEDLIKAAREGLTQPPDSAMWDDRLYNTHAAVMSWADRGDDLIAESNYHTVMAELEGVAVWEDGDNQPEGNDHVIDASASHWLVGSLRQLFVRVYEDDGVTFTKAFIAATSIALYLKEGYPIFDDSDYSEREWTRHQENLEEAFDYTERDYEDDSDTDREAVKDSIHEALSDGNGDELGDHPDVDYDRMADLYREHRDRYFEARAQGHMETYSVDRQVPGQLALID